MPRKPASKALSKADIPPVPIYQVKITLEESKPPIWRRVETPDCTLEDLHEIIQLIMPWESSHLWEFEVTRMERYGPSTDPMGFEIVLDDSDPAEDMTLQKLVEQKCKKFRYLYDFGDSWQHQIVFEKMLTAEPGVKYPRVTAGKLAGPPEDCGGIWGYYEIVSALTDPKHPRHKELKSWYGRKFDPEAFDLDKVNKALAVLRFD